MSSLISEPSAAPVPAQVICLGEALVDRLGALGCDPAEAPSVQCDDRLGGAPANVACGLARLGTPVAFAGRLGADAIGAAFQQLMRQRGVDCSALQIDAERPSRIVLVRRDAQGERSFGGFAGDRGFGFADQALEADALAAALTPLLAGARWLQIGTIPLASRSSAGALRQALALAAAHGVAIALDVNWRPSFWPQGDSEAGAQAAAASIQPLLEQAALLKLAAEEADWLFSSRDPAAIAAALPQHPAVVITDGAAPLRWCAAGRSGALQPYTVPVLDSTGAGDAFLAGLLHRLCAQPALLQTPTDAAVAQALRFASACGALVCQGAGAIDPQPTHNEVIDYLQKNR